MKEIEVKARMREPEAVLNKLNGLGCKFSEPIKQDDIIFLSRDITEFPEDKRGINFLRIRDQDKKIIFTLKQPVTNELDCIEREVVVSDARQMKEILDYLGYQEVVRISKVRKKCRYKEYEVCLDDVKELGEFIEVEKISREDGEEVQKEIVNFLLGLGVKEEDVIVKGYDTLMYNKKKKVK